MKQRTSAKSRCSCCFFHPLYISNGWKSPLLLCWMSVHGSQTVLVASMYGFAVHIFDEGKSKNMVDGFSGVCTSAHLCECVCIGHSASGKWLNGMAWRVAKNSQIWRDQIWLAKIHIYNEHRTTRWDKSFSAKRDGVMLSTSVYESKCLNIKYAAIFQFLAAWLCPFSIQRIFPCVL